MARAKQYIESEVIEKAMGLFWRNGYENTSVRDLEKEMGINQFSIYSSFGNKQGVFVESIKCYKKKLRKELLSKLQSAEKGTAGIQNYFYGFIEFSTENEVSKGCLLTNTANELGVNPEKIIVDSIMDLATDIRSIFIEKLTSKDAKIREAQANYLMVALQGLSVGSKMFDKKQLDDFIEMTFSKI